MASWMADGRYAHKGSKTDRNPVNSLLKREGKEVRERGEGILKIVTAEVIVYSEDFLSGMKPLKRR